MDVTRSRKIGATSLKSLTPSVTEAFQLLNISLDSSDAEIRSAYLRMAFRLHPDRNSNISYNGKVNIFNEKKFNINPHINFNIYIIFIIYSLCY